MKIANKIVDKILGKIVECPLCMGDGLDENMKTCCMCDGAGTIVIDKR